MRFKKAISAVRTLCSRCVRAVSALQQLLARRQNVMDAIYKDGVGTSCERSKDVVCTV